MSQYSKIQFVSWELYTGPLARGGYAGLGTVSSDVHGDLYGQCADIEARLAFTADAMAQAESLSDRSPRTLKVFMAPDFLYRGVGGAYVDGLIDGWQGPAPFALPPFWRSLLAGLRTLAAGARYEDWVVVFGSILGAPLRACTGTGRAVPDAAPPGLLRSVTLVQRGGPRHGRHAHLARKHYPAGAAMLRWHAGREGKVPGTLLPLAPEARLPDGVVGRPDSAVRLCVPTVDDAHGNPIEFGLEVGLDHVGGDAFAGRAAGSFDARSGRIAVAGQPVRVQLVPACGMRLQAQSVRLTPGRGAYAFLCDGLANLNGSIGSHTQCWNGLHGRPEPLPARLLDASAGELWPGTRLAAVAGHVETSRGKVAADSLWDSGNSTATSARAGHGDTAQGAGMRGAGHVRVLTPLDL